MSDITTDFIKATNKIYAKVATILTNLQIIEGDVKLIREQSVKNAHEPHTDADAGTSKDQPQVASGAPSDAVKGSQARRDKHHSDGESASFLERFKKRWKKSLRKPIVQVEIAALIGLGFYTCETHRTNTLTERAMRIDKRAWMDVKSDIGNPAKLPDNCSILTPIQISNTGRIPARRVEIRIATAVLPKDTSPDFGLAPNQKGPAQGTTGVWYAAGVIMPNSPPFTLDDFGPKNNTTSHVILQPEVVTAAAPLLYTPDLKDKINKGEWYVEVHGRITYDDAFGSHWIQFCKFMASHSFQFTNSAKQCVDYNDTDHSD